MGDEVFLCRWGNGLRQGRSAHNATTDINYEYHCLFFFIFTICLSVCLSIYFISSGTRQLERLIVNASRHSHSLLFTICCLLQSTTSTDSTLYTQWKLDSFIHPSSQCLYLLNNANGLPFFFSEFCLPHFPRLPDCFSYHGAVPVS